MGRLYTRATPLHTTVSHTIRTTSVLISVVCVCVYLCAVADAQLRGTSCDVSAALVQQYVNFADSEILPPACTWTFPTLGIMQYNKQVGSNAKGGGAGQGCEDLHF